MTQVKKVTDLVNEIATASSEQTNGIEQISKAIQQMDQVVQQNAANAEETAAASEELSSQAQGLNGLVDKIAAEVNMENNTGGTSVKPATSKKSAGDLFEEEAFVPQKKRSSTICKVASHAQHEETSCEGNGKETVTAEAKASRFIPLSDDEFKDF